MGHAELNRRWVLAGGLWVAASPALGQAADPVVETTAGKIRGVAAGGALAFKGIPYAEPPTGSLRFMPPKAKAPWSGVRDARAYGASAPQRGAAPVIPRPASAEPPYPGPIGSAVPQPPQSEDCLFLNVWTPSTSGKRPVMFWMHGGGFSTGSGSSTW